MSLYPMKLSHITKSTIWGGTGLISLFGKKCDKDTIGETWELTVRANEMSEVLNGEFSGMPLGSVIEKLGNEIVSDTYDGERFPLLIKLIDAADSLSVQVHPDDDYALAHENDPGKTEMWYILAAEPGAKLIYGLAHGIDKEGFAEAVRKGQIGSAMGEISVKAGEIYFIPSGMLHAIGKGIIIAEIQQNSDLTYRVYDFDRRQADGSLRELHIEKALDVTRPFTEDEINAIRYEAKDDEDGDETIVHCRYFKVRHYSQDSKKELCCNRKSFNALLCIGGDGSIETDTESYSIKSGDSYFVPAGMGEYRIAGKADILIASLG